MRIDTSGGGGLVANRNGGGIRATAADARGAVASNLVAGQARAQLVLERGQQLRQGRLLRSR